ncbi:winged helix-turn-helix domain-containing protein [Kitasatospora sp. NPDC001603]|uniref:ArsR/SmtB family transcription factor n=1 Tax=Kitasatospora sp. NPDC001603 TaxID=3154388 RepID=UPI0033289661
MLRIHFTAEDLARTVLTGGRALPVSEAVMSLQTLRRPCGRRFSAWRQHVLQRLPEHASLLGSVVPATGWVPDFLTLGTRASSGPAALDAIRSTPRRRLLADLRRLAGQQRLPSWTGALAAGDRAALDAVVDALAAYYDIAVTPFAGQMRTVLDADRAWRVHTMARAGIGAVLTGLHPRARWQEPVLELPALTGQEEADIHLEGRGLSLCAHVFCGPRPRALINDLDTPVLAYQPVWASRNGHLTPGPSPAGPGRTPGALATLLGRTRAAVLTVLAALDGRTTTQLARDLAISPASASEHVAALRAAGLVTSLRHGNTVRHAATRSGTDLVSAARTCGDGGGE